MLDIVATLWPPLGQKMLIALAERFCIILTKQQIYDCHEDLPPAIFNL